MSDSILLDNICLSKGIPPLSMGKFVAYEMIRELKPSQKRIILRKVRKITRLEINRQCNNVRNLSKKLALRESLERQTNLVKGNKKAHRPVFTRERLHLVKCYFESIVSHESKSYF